MLYDSLLKIYSSNFYMLEELRATDKYVSIDKKKYKTFSLTMGNSVEYCLS